MAGPTVTFEEARRIISTLAKEKARIHAQDESVVSLEQSVGRVAKYDIRCPRPTPTFDTALLVGYAVLSSQTRHASEERPVQLRVMGVLGPGDAPMEVDDRVFNDLVPCVEIRVGALFPIAKSSRAQFDACIPFQHATVVRQGGEGKILQTVNSPLTSWHKRIAGSDFREGDLILEKGGLIAPKHVMACATVGMRDVAVLKSVKAGVISVGSELTTTLLQNNQSTPPFKVPDANGPYLASALREMGIEGEYLGAVPSESQVLAAYLRQMLAREQYDLFIVTEGVLSGSLDVIHKAINALDALVHFDQVCMTPGNQVVFATLPGNDHGQLNRSFYGPDASPSSHFYTPPKTPGNGDRRTEPVIFGVPGAPISSAACFRFLATPYIKHLSGMAEESAILARIAVTPETAFSRMTSGQQVGADLVIEGSVQFDIFRHGVLRSHENGVAVEVSSDRNIAKASPFASSNCWVHVPRGHVGHGQGSVAWVFPFCSPKS